MQPHLPDDLTNHRNLVCLRLLRAIRLVIEPALLRLVPGQIIVEPDLDPALRRNTDETIINPHTPIELLYGLEPNERPLERIEPLLRREVLNFGEPQRHPFEYDLEPDPRRTVKVVVVSLDVEHLHEVLLLRPSVLVFVQLRGVVDRGVQGDLVHFGQLPAPHVRDYLVLVRRGAEFPVRGLEAL